MLIKADSDVIKFRFSSLTTVRYTVSRNRPEPIRQSGSVSKKVFLGFHFSRSLTERLSENFSELPTESITLSAMPFETDKSRLYASSPLEFFWRSEKRSFEAAVQPSDFSLSNRLPFDSFLMFRNSIISEAIVDLRKSDNHSTDDNHSPCRLRRKVSKSDKNQLKNH